MTWRRNDYNLRPITDALNFTETLSFPAKSPFFSKVIVYFKIWKSLVLNVRTVYPVVFRRIRWHNLSGESNESDKSDVVWPTLSVCRIKIGSLSRRGSSSSSLTWHTAGPSTQRCTRIAFAPKSLYVDVPLCIWQLVTKREQSARFRL